jgi:hypothetical protein
MVARGLTGAMTNDDHAEGRDGGAGAVGRPGNPGIEAVSLRKEHVAAASSRVAEVSAELNRRLG